MHSILLVDDEPDILAAWQLILANEGYEVRCAYNGIEALECLEQELPDLVITDWAMPLMDGAELCRRMKAHAGLARVPILVHSAAPPAQVDDRTWTACLRKPVGAPLFLTAVAELCNVHGRQRP